MCLPSQIPEILEVDISELDLGDSLHIRDLKLEGIRVLTEGHLALVTIVAPEVAEAGEEAEEEALEEEAKPESGETSS